MLSTVVVYHLSPQKPYKVNTYYINSPNFIDEERDLKRGFAHGHIGVCSWLLKQKSCQSSYSVQFSSVAQLCPTLCNPMNRSMPGLPVHHQLPEFTQTHVHRVGNAIQPSHPLSSPSPPAPNPSQHQGLLQWVNSSHEVAKVLEFQLQWAHITWP